MKDWNEKLAVWRLIRKVDPTMCEYKEITTYTADELFTGNGEGQTVTIIIDECNTTSILREYRISYYKQLKDRVKTWGILCSKPKLDIFHRIFHDIEEPRREDFWQLIQHVYYNVKDPKGFFEVLMELAIEEKARFHSFADSKQLREWVGSYVGDNFKDAVLMKLYFYIRDGERAIYMDA